MEVLENILKEQKADRLAIEKLTKVVTELAAKVNDPKPVELDEYKVASGLLSVLKPAFKGVESQLTTFSELAGSIPKSVEIKHKKVFDVTKNTAAWLSVVIISILTTYYITPEIAQHRLEQQDIEINNQQFEIDYLREKNPKSAASFDEKYK